MDEKEKRKSIKCRSCGNELGNYDTETGYIATSEGTRVEFKQKTPLMQNAIIYCKCGDKYELSQKIK